MWTWFSESFLALHERTTRLTDCCARRRRRKPRSLPKLRRRRCCRIFSLLDRSRRLPRQLCARRKLSDDPRSRFRLPESGREPPVRWIEDRFFARDDPQLVLDRPEQVRHFHRKRIRIHQPRPFFFFLQIFPRTFFFSRRLFFFLRFRFRLCVVDFLPIDRTDVSRFPFYFEYPFHHSSLPLSSQVPSQTLSQRYLNRCRSDNSPTSPDHFHRRRFRLHRRRTDDKPPVTLAESCRRIGGWRNEAEMHFADYFLPLRFEDMLSDGKRRPGHQVRERRNRHGPTYEVGQ